MENLDLQERFHFRKESREFPIYEQSDEPDLYKIMIKAEEHNNILTTMDEYLGFIAILGDFGINSIVHFNKLDSPDLRGCDHEIRISPQVVFQCFGWPEEQNNQVRYEIYTDAFFGGQEIFKEQIEPANPLGINLTSRQMLAESDFDEVVDHLRTTCEQLPERGQIVELREYTDENDFKVNSKISDFQIRLLYQDPHSQFRDLVSTFRYINSRLCEPFELIIEG